MPSYLTQTAVLRWIPFELRRDFAQAAREFRTPENLQPYYFNDVDIEMMVPGQFRMRTDRTTWIAAPSNADVNMLRIECTTRSGTVTREENKSIDELAKEMMKMLTCRRGNIVRKLRIRHFTVVMGMFRPNPPRPPPSTLDLIDCFKTSGDVPKVTYLRTEGVRQSVTIPCFEHRHNIVHSGQYNLEHIVNTFREQRRAVGSTLRIRIEDNMELCIPLINVVTWFGQLNPHRAIVTMADILRTPRARLEAQRLGIDGFTHMQCVLFEMEHTDLVMFLPTIIPGRRPAPRGAATVYLQKFMVVAKDSVPKCERPEDWLSRLGNGDVGVYGDMSDRPREPEIVLQGDPLDD